MKRLDDGFGCALWGFLAWQSHLLRLEKLGGRWQIHYSVLHILNLRLHKAAKGRCQVGSYKDSPEHIEKGCLLWHTYYHHYDSVIRDLNFNKKNLPPVEDTALYLAEPCKMLYVEEH